MPDAPTWTLLHGAEPPGNPVAFTYTVGAGDRGVPEIILGGLGSDQAQAVLRTQIRWHANLDYPGYPTAETAQDLAVQLRGIVSGPFGPQKPSTNFN